MAWDPPKKPCGHDVGYRCCCHAHQQEEQGRADLVDELTMHPGYRLARAHSRELHGDDDMEDCR